MDHSHLLADIVVTRDASGVVSLTLRAIRPSGWLGRLSWRLRARRIRPVDISLLAPMDTPLFVEPNTHTRWIHANVAPEIAQTSTLSMCSVPQVNAQHLARALRVKGTS